MADESGEQITAEVRVLGERLVYDGPLVQVSEVDLRLPDGDRLPWDVVRLSRSASVVLVDALDRVLLVRRYRCRWCRFSWSRVRWMVSM